MAKLIVSSVPQTSLSSETIAEFEMQNRIRNFGEELEERCKVSFLKKRALEYYPITSLEVVTKLPVCSPTAKHFLQQPSTKKLRSDNCLTEDTGGKWLPSKNSLRDLRATQASQIAFILGLPGSVEATAAFWVKRVDSGFGHSQYQSAAPRKKLIPNCSNQKWASTGQRRKYPSLKLIMTSLANCIEPETIDSFG